MKELVNLFTHFCGHICNQDNQVLIFVEDKEFNALQLEYLAKHDATVDYDDNSNQLCGRFTIDKNEL